MIKENPPASTQHAGKVSRYLLYAIGEIVLVVIGILIALSINNWNEDRKKLNIEIGYLHSLKTEFTQNLAKANESIESYNSLKSAAEKLIRLTGENRKTITEKEFAILAFESIANTTRYTPSPGVLQDLINSGNLSSLSNEKLRLQLSEWFVLLDEAKQQEEDTYEHRNAIIELLIENIPFLNITRDDGTGDILKALSYGSNFEGDTRDILNNRQFENRLALYIVTLWNASGRLYDSIKVHSEQVLLNIEDEIVNLQK